MKVRLLICCLLAVLLGACNGTTSFRGNKKVTQGIHYSLRGEQEAYYEFTSPFSTHSPAPAAEVSQPQPAEETEPVMGEDEDFTSDNLTSSYSRYGDVVVTVSSRRFELGDEPSAKMQSFMRAVETAYTKALRTYRPSGFTYAMSSVGAVDPLSAVQVHCRMSERSANDDGQHICNLFFQTILVDFVRRQQGGN